MSSWRPSGEIRVKVIGIARRGSAFLAVEVTDNSGRVKGVRPLGGSVEFGETREAGLKREFVEELRSEISIRGPWRIFENIYVHEGLVGHEYVFAAEVDLGEKSLYETDSLFFEESAGSVWTARWVDLEEIRAGSLPVFPDGLETMLFHDEVSREV